MDQRALASRLAWITGLRLLFLTLLLGAIAVFYLGGALESYPFSLRIVFVAIATAYALAAAYAFVLRSRRHLDTLAYVQIVCDQVTWTAIVYVSGGATSGATSFYALTCLVGAIAIGARGAALAAVLGLGLYGTLCAAFRFGWLHPPPDQPFATYASASTALAYPLLLNALGIVVVAVLGGYLADRLRATGGALVEATERAVAAERLAELGKIAAWLAHEVRNPLGSISGSIEMLRESPALSEDERQLCDIVQRETNRLNDLVGDMLELSKPRRPEVGPVDVASLAREIVALARRSQGAVARAPVLYDGPDGAAIAECDGSQMRQVLWNLVRNAVQATAAGGAVRVEVSANPGTVELRVVDNGPGIPDAAKARIFDAFYSTRALGAGIGLAVVKQIIDEHAPFGASIAVGDGRPSGAVFKVVLRAAP